MTLAERLRVAVGAANVRGDVVHAGTTEAAARVLRVLAEAGVPAFGEGAPVRISLGRMDALLDVDVESGVAHVQAGARWRRAEWLLRRRGLTLGPIPAWLLDRAILDSFATNDRLRPSPLHGQLTDAALGMTVVLPGGAVARTTVTPRRSTGPDLARLIVGARHRAGLLTEVHLQAWPLPDERTVRAVTLPDWPAAIAAAVAVLRAGVRPAWWRLAKRGDAVELCASLSGAGVDALAQRFDAAAGGRRVEPSPVDALFPMNGPDPRPGEDLPAPFPFAAWAPLPALPAVAAALEGAEVWDVAPEGGTVYAASVPDDLHVRRVRDLGARVAIDGAPLEDAWADLADATLARLAHDSREN